MEKDIKHIAFIADGNRRWARERGIPQLEGHRKGYDLFKDVVLWCKNRGLDEVSIWAFSTENWKRTKEEVGYLMDLALFALTEDLKSLHEKNVRIRVIGRRHDLSRKLQDAIIAAEKKTEGNTGIIMNLCFNYGGRPEIIEAVKSLMQSEISSDDIDEDVLRRHMWTREMRDPDLIVRTSGEQRLSGYLLWAAAYSEIYFCDAFWPDFSEEELDQAIAWFKGRERRFGGDSKKG